MKVRMRPPLLPNHPRSPAGGQVKMNIMSEELAGATRDKTISNKPSEEWLFSFLLLFYNKGKHSRNGKMSYLCKSNPEESGMQIIQQNLITLAHKSNHHKPHLLQSKKHYIARHTISYMIHFQNLNCHTSIPFIVNLWNQDMTNPWGDVDTITCIFSLYSFELFEWFTCPHQQTVPFASHWSYPPVPAKGRLEFQH